MSRLEEKWIDLPGLTGFRYCIKQDLGVLYDAKGDVVQLFDSTTDMRELKAFAGGYAGGYGSGYQRGSEDMKARITVDDVIFRKFELLRKEFDEKLDKRSCFQPGPRD